MNDLTGKKFGKLTVVCRIRNDKCGNRCWSCKCDCGSTIVVLGGNLTSQNTSSCGCLQRELLASRSTKHGHRKDRKETRVYSSWTAMIDRCDNKNNPAYSRYGGRGIMVYRRWKIFENFLRDMGEPPTSDHSVDRIDNDGNYCKSNCRWATTQQQARNKRNNHLIMFNGKTQCISAWAEEIGIKATTILMRIRRCWTPEEALATPVGNQGIKTNAR